MCSISRTIFNRIFRLYKGFPGDSVVKNAPVNAGDVDVSKTLSSLELELTV